MRCSNNTIRPNKDSDYLITNAAVFLTRIIRRYYSNMLLIGGGIVNGNLFLVLMVLFAAFIA